MHPIAAGVLLIGLAIMEQFYPGWSGYYLPAVTITPDTSRIVVAIFVTGAFICLSLAHSRREP